MNINEDKYNNAIKLYHKMKEQRDKQALLSNIAKTPLIKCSPIIKNKIQEHL